MIIIRHMYIYIYGFILITFEFVFAFLFDFNSINEMEVWSGSICCRGEGHCCSFKLGTKTLLSCPSINCMKSPELNQFWFFSMPLNNLIFEAYIIWEFLVNKDR